MGQYDTLSNGKKLDQLQSFQFVLLRSHKGDRDRHLFVGALVMDANGKKTAKKIKNCIYDTQRQRLGTCYTSSILEQTGTAEQSEAKRAKIKQAFLKYCASLKGLHEFAYLPDLTINDDNEGTSIIYCTPAMILSCNAVLLDCCTAVLLHCCNYYLYYPFN